MPRLTEERKQERREQISAAAKRCFARQGFAATSMADIIAESGLSAGSIYSHFKSKADLVRFASAGHLEFGFGNVMSGLASTSEPTPGLLLERLLQLTSTYRVQLSVLLQIWVESERDAELAAIARENIAKLGGLIQSVLEPWAKRRAADGEDARAIAEAMTNTLIVTFQGFMLRLNLDPELDAKSLSNQILATFEKRA